LARSKNNPLAGLEITGYRPQPEGDVERIDAHGAPERQLAELVLQRMTVGTERYAIAI
jgi:hypothetical protein